MNMWLAVLIPSALFGTILGYLTAKRSAGVRSAGDLLSIIVPCAAVFLWAYFGISKSEPMWIIAVFVTGIPAAITSALSHKITQSIFRKRKNNG